MQEKERLIEVLSGRTVDRPPCACPLQTGTVDLMKESGAFWPQAHIEPLAMARLARAAHDIGGLESVRVPFDLGVDASAFGVPTDQRRLIRQPTILDRAVRTPDELFDRPFPDPHYDGRVPVVLKALEVLQQEMPEVPHICGIVGPFMLCCQLHGEQVTFKEIDERPEFMRSILHLAAEWASTYAEAAIRAGAEVICILDGTSSGDVLDHEHYRHFALPYQQRIAQAVRGVDGRSILHICGNIRPNLDLIAQSGFDGLSLDHIMSMAEVRKVLPRSMACVGNVAPISSLLMGTPSEVEAETLKAIENGTDVVAPGCGFAPETPLTNMRAMSSTVKGYVRPAGRR